MASLIYLFLGILRTESIFSVSPNMESSILSDTVFIFYLNYTSKVYHFSISIFKNSVKMLNRLIVALADFINFFIAYCFFHPPFGDWGTCLLYTSDAADDLL